MRVMRFGSLVLVLGVVGCSDPFDGRVEVKGTVTFKGQSLTDATVSFSPLEGQNTQAQVMVTDGKYRIERQTGLKPGKYLIRVSKGDGKTPYLKDGEAPGPTNTNIISKELVPDDWNINSKQERTVTKDNPNNFDFSIP
jgi:hypothetical protein